MTEPNTNESMLAALDRVMRLLRRGHSANSHGGRSLYRILGIIHKQDGISTRELAELLDMRPSSLNERLFDLEHDGLIVRTRNENDQRVFIVRLLAKGIEQLEHIKHERVAFNAKVAHILSEEEAIELTKLTLKLANGLEDLTLTDVTNKHRGHHR